MATPNFVLTVVALVCVAPLAALGAPAIAAKNHRIDCPAELPEASLKIVGAPEGWTPSVRGGVPLQSIDISDGPPEEKAFLKPDFSTRHGGEFEDRWVDLNTARTSHGAWIVCNYGDSNAANLGKRLNNAVSECTATYGNDAQRRKTIAVSCKW